jgi:hypothetical protein
MCYLFVLNSCFGSMSCALTSEADFLEYRSPLCTNSPLSSPKTLADWLYCSALCLKGKLSFINIQLLLEFSLFA